MKLLYSFLLICIFTLLIFKGIEYTKKQIEINEIVDDMRVLIEEAIYKPKETIE